MSNQDIQGDAPADEAPSAAAGTPEYFEQQLAKEREARTLMRDRLRHTEALAAESHALRSRMAQELERVTADRDRLRVAAAAGATAGDATATSTSNASKIEATQPIPPLFTPRAVDMPLLPPPPPRRGGPWGALAMLGALALAVGAFAWYSGSVPGLPRPGGNATTAANDAAPPTNAHDTAPPIATEAPPPPTAASALGRDTTTARADTPTGAVPLPPLTQAQAQLQAQAQPPSPEAQLAAAPTAAGPAPAPAQADAPAGLAARLRKTLDGEGIASPVEIDATSGRVSVADPQADAALRSRTDMLIRAVYAGASLPEPQIEHRWISPKRGAAPAPAASLSPAEAYAARHAAHEPQDAARHKPGATTVADVESLRPVLPEGRVTASCRESLAGRTLHRADMTACMKHSCCSSAANHNAEDCRAYEKAYPFTCGG